MCHDFLNCYPSGEFSRINVAIFPEGAAAAPAARLRAMSPHSANLIPTFEIMSSLVCLEFGDATYFSQIRGIIFDSRMEVYQF